jgi:Lrp/AsnC family transcriptional regulator, leucine-responsive regulatory protein
MPSSHASSTVLDETNRQILVELVADPRLSMSALGRRIGMSSPAVTERVQRLENSGVISGYATIVDPVALGYSITAFTRIKPTPGQIPKIAQLAAGIPQVTECHRITGEDCYLIKIHARTIQDIEVVLDQFSLYGQSVTSIVQSSPVRSRALPIGLD